jgi:hypothetical protein
VIKSKEIKRRKGRPQSPKKSLYSQRSVTIQFHPKRSRKEEKRKKKEKGKSNKLTRSGIPKRNTKTRTLKLPKTSEEQDNMIERAVRDVETGL